MISGIGGLGGAAGANPLAGMGGAPGLQGAGGQLSGLGDLGLGDTDGAGSGGMGAGSAGSGLGLMPSQSATPAQGGSFGDALKSMVIDNPSRSKARATDLAARFSAGDTSIDPHVLSIQSAKAGVEIQMATRTISSAVSSVRTLFQMQV